MEIESKAHNKKVEDLKQILVKNNLPILPLNTVKCAFFTPDVITRNYMKFIPIDYVNSKAQLNFDIGGLVMIAGKDICEFAIAVIDDELWEKHEHDFKKVKLNLPPRLTMITMNDCEEYFLNLGDKTKLRKPP